MGALSPHARSFVHRKCLVWSIGLLGFAAVLRYQGSGESFQSLLVVVGLVLLVPGAIGELRAQRYNRRDLALANALAESFESLCVSPPQIAYAADESSVVISGARLVEVERHFDAHAAGTMEGAMNHQLSLFGAVLSRSFADDTMSAGAFGGVINGLSQAHFTMQSTTRDSLVGDALFAVFEVNDGSPEQDTWRVISTSRGGAASWISDLILSIGGQLGGASTHAGLTVHAWSQNLVDHFAPPDISYATDQLTAQLRHPFAERAEVAVVGSPTGRNAVIATQIVVGHRTLLLMPTWFPQILAASVSDAVAQADRRVSGTTAPPEILH